MNIYKYEFKSYIKSTALWSLSIIALSYLMMVFYPTFSEDTQMLDKMLENYPKELMEAFGMNTGISMATVLGYFAFAYVFIQLCIAVQASYYGFSFLSIEERELTADFLLTKPVSRKKVLLSKFLAVFTHLTITNIVAWIATFTSIEAFRNGNSYDSNHILVLLSSIAIFQLFFLAAGMLVTVLTKRIRNVLSYAMGLSFIMYVLNAAKGVIDGKILGYITPFYHFEAGYILEKGEYNLKMTLISVCFIVISIVFSYFKYQKRNIHSL